MVLTTRLLGPHWMHQTLVYLVWDSESSDSSRLPKSTKVEATKTSFSLDPGVTPAQCHLVKVSHRTSPGSLWEGLQKGVNTGKQGSLGPICEDQLSQ